METATKTVRTALTGRLIDVLPTTSLRAAANLLQEEYVGALLVDTRAGTAGILTERDIVRALGDGADPDEARVEDHLTEDLATVTPDTPLAEALGIMFRNEIRHLVVVDEGAVVGVVSMRAVLEPLLGLLDASPHSPA